MKEPPRDFSICPCCGTEFGFDDFEMTVDELRKQWMFRGMPWFSTYTMAPLGWNAYTQLAGLSDCVQTELSDNSEMLIITFEEDDAAIMNLNVSNCGIVATA